MNNRFRRLSLLAAGILWGLAPVGRAQPAPVLAGSLEASDPVSSPSLPAKVVPYGPKDVIPLNAKIRYSTLIILPKSEQILDFTCGDKEFWIVNGNQNFAYVKPAKPGAQTNLNLVTASGNVYSFTLSEISAKPSVPTDLKVFVELKDEAMLAASRAAPRFISSEALDGFKRELDAAKEETRRAKESSQAAIDTGIGRFLDSVRFPYHFEAGRKPFYVRAMYHDNRFTYIQARPEETPTLYEIRDGQPNLVNFEYKNGVYVVDKIVDRGYLAIGKHKWGFSREE